MLTTCKNQIKAALAGITVDGVAIDGQNIFLDASDINRRRPLHYAVVVTGSDVLAPKWTTEDKGFRDGGLKVCKRKYDRTLSLLVTIGGHSEDWVDQLVDNLLATLPRWILDGEDDVEIIPHAMEWMDSEAVIKGKAAAVIIRIDYKKPIKEWNVVPYFNKVTIETAVGNDLAE